MEVCVRNVNEALYEGMKLLGSKSVRTAPRGMNTVEYPEPVITIYDRPWERVLFNPVRNANPFLHFFESLWMLAGRDDVAFMEQFSKAFSAFSDDGVRMFGAYGGRWRHMWFDQLHAIIELLTSDRTTRRAVLTMWSPMVDLHGGKNGLDLPCNTQVFFKIRPKEWSEAGVTIVRDTLRTTVCCRSNDMVWGAYGTDSVDFSMLHEYVASKVGVKMGQMVQISDSFHAYESPHPSGKVYENLKTADRVDFLDRYNTIRLGEPFAVPCGMGSPTWDEDLMVFFTAWDHGIDASYPKIGDIKFRNWWFSTVVQPMYAAWMTRSVQEAAKIAAPDWRRAAVEWLERREK